MSENSEYGNVPIEDVQAVRVAVQMAGRVAASLSVTAPGTWREVAYEAVLDAILQDWVEIGTNELSSEDEADHSNLLRVSADVASVQESSRRDSTFRLLCRNAMQDWVKNWNSEDEEDDDDDE
jgi:hypothetical protein